MPKEDRLKKIINEQSLQLIQAETVIRRLVSAGKMIERAHELYSTTEWRAIMNAIFGGEGWLGESVSPSHVVDELLSCER